MAETTNNPIWKGDNFGSPKITTKYLNYTGLADFWSRVKTYIDEQDASRNGQNIPLYPIGTESNKSITSAIEDLSNAVNGLNIITLDMLDDVWEDVIEYDDIVLDQGVLNEYKLG